MAITLKGNEKINNNINSPFSACEGIVRGLHNISNFYNLKIKSPWPVIFVMKIVCYAIFSNI